MGTRLLERGAARIVRTDEGRRFLGHPRRLLEDYEEAVAERVRRPSGRVRISAPMAFGEHGAHRRTLPPDLVARR